MLSPRNIHLLKYLASPETISATDSETMELYATAPYVKNDNLKISREDMYAAAASVSIISSAYKAVFQIYRNSEESGSEDLYD